jgi:hypothetical protein
MVRLCARDAVERHVRPIGGSAAREASSLRLPSPETVISNILVSGSDLTKYLRPFLERFTPLM